MPHDYANRGKRTRPAARKTGPAKSSPKRQAPAPRRGLPWVSLISLVLVAGFGYGLYRLTLVNPDPQATQQAVRQPQAQDSEPVAPKASEVDEPRDEGFDFYRLLPRSEVVPPEVEAYKSTPKSAENHTEYRLQAGSFRSASDADSLRAKLILLGMPNVTSSKVTSANGTVWYRVRLGPFESRSKLNKAQDQLVAMRLQPMQVKVQ